MSFGACNNNPNNNSSNNTFESNVNTNNEISADVQNTIKWIESMWDDFYDLMNVKLEYDNSKEYSFINEDGIEFANYYRVIDKRFQSPEDISDFLENHFTYMSESFFRICFDYMEVEPNHYAVIDGNLCMLVVDYDLERGGKRYDVDFDDFVYNLRDENSLDINFVDIYGEDFPVYLTKINGKWIMTELWC